MAMLKALTWTSSDTFSIQRHSGRKERKTGRTKLPACKSLTPEAVSFYYITFCLYACTVTAIFFFFSPFFLFPSNWIITFQTQQHRHSVVWHLWQLPQTIAWKDTAIPLHDTICLLCVVMWRMGNWRFALWIGKENTNLLSYPAGCG